jgi:WXG100 family type VII secretion target
LRFDYDVVETAIKQIKAAKADLEKKTNVLTKSVGQLDLSFKGKAARAFQNGWNTKGKPGSQGMLKLLDQDWQRLSKIAEMVKRCDSETAALFAKRK